MSRPKLPILKLTILNLSGIHISQSFNSSLYDDSSSLDNLPTSPSSESTTPDHFSITASITFTGSCNSSDMRIVSSTLCSKSGRLFVESRPVVVPVGMTDGLIAAWDDSSATLTIPKDRSLYFDNALAKRKGIIMAIPHALPHLFVKLNECKHASPAKKLFSTRELMKIDSSLGLSTMSSLSEGPELDENDLRVLVEDNLDENEDLELRSILRQNEDISKCCSKTVDETIDQSNRSNSNSQTYQEGLSVEDSFNLKSNLTVINSPCQSEESSSIPEILEMQISLHINQVPDQTNHDEYPEHDKKVAVKSACLPCNEGGGAVSHLVLFNDFLLNEIEKGFRENGEDVEDGRIVVLPVRKRTPPINRAVSSISGSGSKSSRDSNTAANKRLRTPLNRNNEIWVDLEEDATISVRLERCAAEEDPFIARETDQNIYNGNNPNTSSIKATKKVNSNPQTPSHDQENFQPTDFVKNSTFFKGKALSGNAVFSSRDKHVNGQNFTCNGNGQIVRLSDEAQPDLYLSDQTIGSYNGKKGFGTTKSDVSPLKMVEEAPRMMCAPALDLDGLLSKIMNLMSHCGDDVQGYDIHGVMSMDSTIHTSGSI